MKGKQDEDLFLRLYALNEIDAKLNSSIDWRQKLESQRGAVLATELKNNSNKLAKWTLQAMLAGADLIKLGFVSRTNPKLNESHVILGTGVYKPRELAPRRVLAVPRLHLDGCPAHVLLLLRDLLLLGHFVEPHAPRLGNELQILFDQRQDRDARQIDLLIARQGQQQVQRPFEAFDIDTQARRARIEARACARASRSTRRAFARHRARPRKARPRSLPFPRIEPTTGLLGDGAVFAVVFRAFRCVCFVFSRIQGL